MSVYKMNLGIGSETSHNPPRQQRRSTRTGVRLNSERRAEHDVPKLARHTEPKLEVLVMMRQVVALHLADVRRKTRVMQPRSSCISAKGEREEEGKGRLTRSACNRRERRT